jgi:hypothetical protein
LLGSANSYITAITAGLRADVAGAGAKWSANANMFQVPSFAGLPFSPLQAPTMLFNFKSTQPTDSHIRALNIVPYSNKMRYIVSQAPTTVASKASTDLNSSNIQISQLPDCFIIYARKVWTTQGVSDANYFAQINSISINLSNNSGLLAGASPEQLWRLSRKNGSNQSWVEFSGGLSVNQNPYTTTASSTVVATTGSMLVIAPEDLSLPSYMSAGSITNANLQFRLNVTNQQGDPVQYELVVICVNSGILSTNNGTSQIFQGLLTKELVLATQEQGEAGALTAMESERLVGGKMRRPIHPAFLRSRMGVSGARSAGVGNMGHPPKSRLSGMY